MWKYWLLSVLIALVLGWGALQYVGGGHVTSEMAWYVLPVVATLVTAVSFKEATAGRLATIGLICLAVGGLGSAYWSLLTIVFLIGLGVLAAAIANWLTHHVKVLAA